MAHGTSPEVRRFRSLLASGQLVHAEFFQQEISDERDDCVAATLQT
jgi:hypothetical protein